MAEALGGSSPRPSCLITAVFAVIFLVSLLLTLVLQLVLAVLTSPMLLCCHSGFHHLQSYVFRGVMSFVCIGLNPFWCTSVRWLGARAGHPRGKLGSVIFCNHRSNANAFFSSWVLARSLIEARYVYKSSLNDTPAGPCLLLAGDLSVKFGNPSAIADMKERAKALLRAGYNIVVFPEGTRSPSGLLQEFKLGFFRICMEVGCPAVPMVLLGTERAWPLGGGLLGRATELAAIGEPLDPHPGPDAAERLAVDMAHRMEEMARELLAGAPAAVAASDPFTTGLPYPWWQPSGDLVGLPLEEQVKLLRAGQTHARGQRLL